MSGGSAALALVGGVLAIAAILGLAYGVFRTTAKTRTIELYEGENAVLGKSNARMETEIIRLQTKLDATMAANLVLQETVSGSAAVKKLAEDIAREEGFRREEHATQIVILKDLLAQLRSGRGAIGR